jgi:rhodanese-related sulfurtransferase
MRIVPIALTLIAGLSAGCAEQAEVDMRGTAAALAKTIAAERDHVTVAELSDWIIKDRRDFELLDIRDQADFGVDHIAGARHVPLAALMSDAALAGLPPGRKVVVYSNGTAHAAQAALLLRLVDREAYALLGGFNHWRAYLHDPDSAGVAEMDPAQRAQYQAVACFFEGDYVADAGLAAPDAPVQADPEDPVAGGSDPLGLGLDLGLGTDAVKDMGQGGRPDVPPASSDPLGLGLDLGLGGEAAGSLQQGGQAKPPGSAAKLLIRAEC